MKKLVFISTFLSIASGRAVGPTKPEVDGNGIDFGCGRLMKKFAAFILLGVLWNLHAIGDDKLVFPCDVKDSKTRIIVIPQNHRCKRCESYAHKHLELAIKNEAYYLEEFPLRHLERDRDSQDLLRVTSGHYVGVGGTWEHEIATVLMLTQILEQKTAAPVFHLFAEAVGENSALVHGMRNLSEDNLSETERKFREFYIKVVRMNDEVWPNKLGSHPESGSISTQVKALEPKENLPAVQSLLGKALEQLVTDLTSDVKAEELKAPILPSSVAKLLTEYSAALKGNKKREMETLLNVNGLLELTSTWRNRALVENIAKLYCQVIQEDKDLYFSTGAFHLVGVYHALRERMIASGGDPGLVEPDLNINQHYHWFFPHTHKTMKNSEVYKTVKELHSLDLKKDFGDRSTMLSSKLKTLDESYELSEASE